MAEPLCILTGGKLLVLAISSFSLSWTHSVEKIDWTEHWQVMQGRLQITEARVQGSGAGMEPPEGAIASAQGWTYVPHVPPLKQVMLASSGATASPWRLCGPDAQCVLLGQSEGDASVLWVGDDTGCHRDP